MKNSIKFLAAGLIMLSTSGAFASTANSSFLKTATYSELTGSQPSIAKKKTDASGKTKADKKKAREEKKAAKKAKREAAKSSTTKTPNTSK